MRITAWDLSWNVNHLSKVKTVTEFTRSISSARIGKPVLMMDMEVSKDTTIADRLIRRTSSMLHETESKTMQKDEEGRV